VEVEGERAVRGDGGPQLGLALLGHANDPRVESMAAAFGL
jgi:hypothetical protein